MFQDLGVIIGIIVGFLGGVSLLLMLATYLETTLDRLDSKRPHKVR